MTNRRRLARSTALSVWALLVALMFSDQAFAHVVPVPQLLRTGPLRTVSFAVPNERPEPMSGVTIDVPEGFRIIRARPANGWTVTATGSTSTWRGGPLEHLAIETFRLDVSVEADPGLVTLDTTQLYPSGATVHWPATLTVVSGEGTGRAPIGWTLIAAVVGVGLLVSIGVALVALRR